MPGSIARTRRRRIVKTRTRSRSCPYTVTRWRCIAMRMAVMRAAVYPIVIERIPAPVNETGPSPNAIHITQAETSVRNNVIDNTRVVFRNVHIFFANRLNRHVVINLHSNLIITIQIAILVGNLAHSLHCIHHIGFLHFDRFTELFCPRRIFCKLAEDIRKRDKRNH